MRRKIFYCEIRPELERVFHVLASQNDCKITNTPCARSCPYVNRKTSKISSNIVGFIKVKSAIVIAREINNKARNFNGEHFWARGYAISTVGFDKEVVKRYIHEQEQNEVSAERGRF